ncbi:hypothetical protein HAX54_004899 [Datura stramonium]|uniref:MSP domain-containing protein n=1 Tax=Datura stramonium TaxID=4076 RepID=A0ABS8WT44_DATST|nr:hypothetical protein [Datura stramonium]
MSGATNQYISVTESEAQFQFELEKQSYCDLKVTNSTEHYIAFKVKTTSPKSTLFGQTRVSYIPGIHVLYEIYKLKKEYPPDMQCKDKFLLQSTIVNNDADELPPDTSAKLRVVALSSLISWTFEDGFKQSSDGNSLDPKQFLNEAKDVIVKQFSVPEMKGMQFSDRLTAAATGTVRGAEEAKSEK